MSTITMRDLSSTRELDRKAMSAVKGGTSPLTPRPPLYPVHVKITDTSKWVSQYQAAHVSNTAVGQGGPKGGSNVFNQVGVIEQSQFA